MPSYRWSAVSASGDLVNGISEAPNQATVVERLQRQGQIVLTAEPAERRNRLAELIHLELGPRRGLDRATLGEVTRELAIMLGATQDLDRALRFVVDNSRNERARAVLTALRDQGRAGKPLASGMAGFPESFPRLYVGVVRAGEAGGTLAATLDRLAALLERESALRAELRAAMIYPCLLIVAAITSIVLLLEYVLPQFVPIFEQAGAELPAATRTLLLVGSIVGAIGPWLIAAGLAAGLLARRALARPGWRYRADRLLLTLPVVGRLVREVLAGRFTRTLGILLTNGVPLLSALSIAEEALGNLAAAEAVNTAAIGAKAGRGLAGPLGERCLFPPRMTHLLQLGEEAEQLPTMALKAADIHDNEAQLLLRRIVSLLVPAITITMGLVVAGIVGSLLSAMLRLNDLAI